jgi:dihydroorotase
MYTILGQIENQYIDDQFVQIDSYANINEAQIALQHMQAFDCFSNYKNYYIIKKQKD